MVTSEFDLIARYFTRSSPGGQRALLGVGDDCALINVALGQSLAISTDTLCAGTHFFADADAKLLGHKALAVNLSDLAAMGATPRYATLALTLPNVNEAWVASFADGFFALADAYDCELIGGDTTRGPLSITVTVFGELLAHNAFRRDAAQSGDDVWLSGTVGGAALGLAHLQQKLVLPTTVADRALVRLHAPTPRVHLGVALAGIAHAAIDVSDGLVADLGHIAQRSNGAAVLQWERIPLHPTLLAVAPDWRQSCALSGGDDYELCFTAALTAREAVEAAARSSGTAVTRVGVIVPKGAGMPNVTVNDEHGQPLPLARGGYDHFAAA